ncbi:MAG: mucin-binding protein, partial [Lactobacillus acidophilus]
VELNSKTITGQTISGAHQNDLNQVITRKITIYEPDKKVQTIKQIARIYRNAMIDNVTGKVKYNDWSNRSKYSHHL